MMLGRLFGKGKDASDAPVCYQCGRTLLAGEWTEKIEGPDGEERLLCSLCGQASPPSAGERLKVGNDDGAARGADDDAEPAAGQPPQRGENDALWKAIKDRDAQIEALSERLAQSEAERQELIGRLARLQAGVATAAATTEPEADAGRPAPEADAGRLALEDTAAIPSVEGEEAQDEVTEAEGADGAGAETVAADVETADAGLAGDATAASEPLDEAETTLETSAADAAATRAEADRPADDAALDTSAAEAQAASMTLLQRGVDLLNVSPVPRKIAETNADLGVPTVHVGFDGAAASVTFMWSMGWYRFAVDIESAGVRLDDRGFEDRHDLQPNASVRADGTVHLAAARISRAAAQRQPDAAAGDVGSATGADAAKPPAEPTPAASGGPEILSKSLLGQRTDDERPGWEQTQAREFDWER